MNETLSIKEAPKTEKETEEVSKDASKSPKVVIATALMSAISTILVSFIAIVPQLRRSDAEEIKALRQDISNLQTNRGQTDPVSLGKKLNIRGTIKSLDGKRPFDGTYVLLLPEGAGRTTETNTLGVFNFSGIPDETYSLIVRDAAKGKTWKLLLDEAEDEVPLDGVKINYRKLP